MAGKPQPKLAGIVERIARQHGPPPKPIPRSPFEWVLWENVAYLVDDERRAEAFRDLKRRVGLDPHAIAAARVDDLQAVVRGMRPQDRALRLRECAEIALELGGGDLRQLLDLPSAKALAALKRFPGIGAPGAEKILMFCGALPVLALESNGLRVLLRVGYGREDPTSYAKSYRSVHAALEPELPSGAAQLARAHQLLRRHGQEICKSAEPDCAACCLATRCRSSRV
jgi:endonuclease-3